MNESPSTDEPFDAERFAAETIWSIERTDEDAAALELRVARLEELVAARWPRSMFLRRRLARELRASVGQLGAPGLPSDWVTRRIEAAGLQVSYEAQERRRRDR